MSFFKQPVTKTLAGASLMLALLYFGFPYLQHLMIESSIKQSEQHYMEPINNRQKSVQSSLDQLDIKDPNLEKCIRQAAQFRSQIHPLSSGGIDNVNELTQLDCYAQNIQRLDGIAALVNLKRVDFSDNKIQSISPLKSLKKLEYLMLRDNPIKDIDIISQLPHLKTIYFPDLPDMFCYEIKQKITMQRNNLDSIQCKGKWNPSIARLQQHKSRGGTLSKQEEQRLYEYDFNQKMARLNND
ncbi:MAG: hypothetical protein ACWA5R_13770 [bacterium]